jgi:hypothetical protein
MRQRHYLVDMLSVCRQQRVCWTKTPAMPGASVSRIGWTAYSEAFRVIFYQKLQINI